MAIINKITHGFVVQQFDSDTCKFVHQEFIAGDEIEFEDVQGNTIEAFPEYLEFDMIQPS